MNDMTIQHWLKLADSVETSNNNDHLRMPFLGHHPSNIEDTVNLMKSNELYEKLLWWQPEIEFADDGKDKLMITLDLFNNHIIWEVQHSDGSYTECADFDDAVKKFAEGE